MKNKTLIVGTLAGIGHDDHLQTNLLDNGYVVLPEPKEYKVLDSDYNFINAMRKRKHNPRRFDTDKEEPKGIFQMMEQGSMYPDERRELNLRLAKEKLKAHLKQASENNKAK